MNAFPTPSLVLEIRWEAGEAPSHQSSVKGSHVDSAEDQRKTSAEQGGDEEQARSVGEVEQVHQEFERGRKCRAESEISRSLLQLSKDEASLCCVRAQVSGTPCLERDELGFQCRRGEAPVKAGR